jgi:hypothetical protein
MLCRRSPAFECLSGQHFFTEDCVDPLHVLGTHDLLRARSPPPSTPTAALTFVKVNNDDVV